MVESKFTVLPATSVRTDLPKVKRSEITPYVDRVQAYKDLLFSAGEAGVIFSPLQSGLYQDAAGTIPVDYAGETCGKINDASGNGNHATEYATAGGPTYAGMYFEHPAIHNGSINFALPTRPTAMSMFFVMRGVVPTGQQVLFSVKDPAASGNLGVTQDGSTSASSTVVGTPTYYRNGVPFTGTTRDDLYEAVKDAPAKVIEIRGINISNINFAEVQLGSNKSGLSPIRYSLGDFILVTKPSDAVAAQVTALMMKFYGIVS